MTPFFIFVKITHIILILYVVFGLYFSNSIPFILLYLMTLFTLYIHWFFNDDSCFLTLLEKKLTNVSDEESFIKSIVNPIYVIKDENISQISKTTVIILFIIGSYKLYNTGEFIDFLKNPFDPIFYR